MTADMQLVSTKRKSLGLKLTTTLAKSFSIKKILEF